MKKILLAACALLLTVSSVFGQNYMKRYKVSDLHGIRACSIFDVTIEEGNTDLVQVITDRDSREWLNYVTVRDDSGILTLDIDERGARKAGLINRFGQWKDKNVHLMVNAKMKKLDAVILSGASKLKTKGTFKGGKVTCKISGAAFMDNTTLAVESLNADVSGAGKMFVNGCFKIVNLELSGASVTCLNGTMVDLTGSLSGASKLRTDVTSNSLNVELSGASNADLNGNAQLIKLECSGASKCEASDLNARNAEVDLSGVSKATVKAMSTVTGEVNTMAHLTCYGNAQVKIDSKNVTIK